MVFDFSKLNLKERPMLILETLSGRKLQTLGYAIDVEPSLRYNETSELSFSVPRQIDGKKTPHYDDIEGWNVVELKNLGKFILMNPETESTGIKEMKHCKAYSLEYEWVFKKLALPKDVYNFWNPVAPEDSLLGRIMERVPHWKLGTVDATLIGVYRSFDESDDNLYNFVKSTVQKSVGCIFEFDTLTRTVHVRDVSSRVDIAPVQLSMRNLLKKVSIPEDSENITTCVSVNGAEGVDIQGVNPTGLNKLYNLDYFMNPTHFSPQVIQKWTSWKEACETRRQYYFDLTLERDLQSSRWLAESAYMIQLEKEMSGLEAQQAATIQSTENQEIKEIHLKELKEKIEALQADIEKQKEKLASAETDMTALGEQLESINRELDFSSFFTEKELLTLQMYFREDAIEETTFVLPSVTTYDTEDESMDWSTSECRIGPAEGMSLETPGITITKVFHSYLPDKTLYSIEGGFLTTGVLSANISRGAFEAKETGDFVLSLYLGKGKFGEREFSSGCVSMTGSCSGIHDNTVPDKDAPEAYATGTELRFTISEGYLYFTENLTDYQQHSVEWDLLEWGQDTLQKLSSPTFSFSVDSANFLTLDEFASFKNGLKLGARCYAEMEPGKILTPILTGVDCSYRDISFMKLEFSDSFSSSDVSFQLKDLLEDSITMGRRVDYSKYTYSSFVDSGAATEVESFLKNSLDVAKNNILSAAGQAISWNENGMKFRKWNENRTGYEPKQMWAINNELVFTDDNFSSVKTALGEINVGGTSMYGISGEALLGNLIAGNYLMIESEKKNGLGQSVFKVDGSGVQLHDATFDIFSGSKRQIMLNPDIGLALGEYPLLEDDNVVNREKAKLFFDINTGNLTVGGKIDAQQFLINGKDALNDDDSKISGDFIDAYGLSVYQKGHLGDENYKTFEINSNGDVSLSGTINWEKTNSDPASAGAKEIAESIANGTYEGGTFINGKMIYSPEIYANRFQVNSENAIDPYGFYLRYGNQDIFSITYKVDNMYGLSIRAYNQGNDRAMLLGRFLLSGSFNTEKGSSFGFGGPVSAGSQSTIDFSQAASMKLPSNCDIECHKVSVGTGGLTYQLYPSGKIGGLTTTFERIFRRLKALDGETDTIFDFA